MGSGAPATMAAVAAMASASSRDVALVAAADHRVQTDVRQRIVEAMNATAFRPLAALQAKLGRPPRFAIVMKVYRVDIPEENRFYVPIASAIAHACAAHGAEVVHETMVVDDRYELVEPPRGLGDGSCDGVFLVGAQLSSTLARQLADLGTPAVLVDGYADGDPFDSVVTDNETGGRMAVEHLVAAGHTEIGLLGTEPGCFPSMLGRRTGYRSALEAYGLEPYFIDTPYLLTDAAAIVGLRYLEDHPEVTAVFGANDVITVGLLQAARNAGYVLPADLSLVGFDDIDLANLVMPALTTLAVDKSLMGRAGFALLAHRLEFPDAAPIQSVVAPLLVERESVARAPRR
jgi:LacI family transcriptional regulator